MPDMTHVALTLHPQVQALLADCAALQDELARLIAEHDLLVTTVGPNLEAEYQAQIGRYELERFRVDLEVRRVRRTLELLQAAVNRMERITRRQVETQLASAYAANEVLSRLLDAGKLIYGRITHLEWQDCWLRIEMCVYMREM
jgi:hypothetical protein